MMLKRKLTGLLLTMLLLPIITIGHCECKKDSNHKHEEETNVCEICHQECECNNDILDPSFEYDPGTSW